jgi:hypothetical protein
VVGWNGEPREAGGGSLNVNEWRDGLTCLA